MTASELAFLALGILLGAATGAALLMAIGSRPSGREIRVTVTRGAVPGRSETLSHGAFSTRPAEPARGGPGDRRQSDREVLSPASGADHHAPGARPGDHPERGPALVPDRTIVPSVAAAVAIAIHPETDRELADLRRRPARGSALERMLRGEHRAMVEVVDSVAGDDPGRRRTWELLLGGLVEALGDVAVAESVIDFPMGTAFWDSFTVEQCRRIVTALTSMGYHYDGQAGWADGRVPAYRDLTQAMADIGLEPRRVRAWPNASEIATLFVGARPAPEELLPAAGPDYTAADMRALLGTRADALADLWIGWDRVRPVLLDEPPVESPVAVEAELPSHS